MSLSIQIKNELDRKERVPLLQNNDRAKSSKSKSRACCLFFTPSKLKLPEHEKAPQENKRLPGDILHLIAEFACSSQLSRVNKVCSIVNKRVRYHHRELALLSKKPADYSLSIRDITQLRSDLRTISKELNLDNPQGVEIYHMLQQITVTPSSSSDTRMKCHAFGICIILIGGCFWAVYREFERDSDSISESIKKISLISAIICFVSGIFSNSCCAGLYFHRENKYLAKIDIAAQFLQERAQSNRIVLPARPENNAHNWFEQVYRDFPDIAFVKRERD